MGITTEPTVGDADAESADDKEFIAAVLGCFALPDVDKAYALLEKIAMPAKGLGTEPHRKVLGKLTE